VGIKVHKNHHSRFPETDWSEPARTFCKIEKIRAFVRHGGLCLEQSPQNSFKRLYTVKGLLVLVEKASFSKKIRGESIAVFGFCFNSHTASPGARGWHFNLLLIPGGGWVDVNLAAKATFLEEAGAIFYLTGMPYGRC